MEKIRKIPKNIFIGLIKIYQKYISGLFGAKCRFYPTCSAYAIEAIDKYGIIKGTILAIKRVAKCHPLHVGGVDKLK